MRPGKKMATQHCSRRSVRKKDFSAPDFMLLPLKCTPTFPLAKGFFTYSEILTLVVSRQLSVTFPPLCSSFHFTLRLNSAFPMFIQLQGNSSFLLLRQKKYSCLPPIFCIRRTPFDKFQIFSSLPRLRWSFLFSSLKWAKRLPRHTRWHNPFLRKLVLGGGWQLSTMGKGMDLGARQIDWVQAFY